jgi:hypothetical protein
VSSVYRGPFASSEQLLQSFKAVKFVSGLAADLMSFGAEGLAQALAVLEDVASKRKAYRGRNVDLSQFIVFIANSNSLNLPVMDVRQFFGQFLNGN